MKKFVMFAIKRTISKFSTHMLAREYKKLKYEKDECDEPSDLIYYEFLLKLLIFITPYILNKSGLKTLNGQ